MPERVESAGVALWNEETRFASGPIGVFHKVYRVSSSPYGDMSNTFMGFCRLSGDASATNLYLDTAAELSVIDRKGHNQVNGKGKPLVYDMLFTINTVPTTIANVSGDNGLLGLSVYTCPNNWQTRNAVRMAHFLREDLRKASGVSKGSIGKYAKHMRFNMDSSMFNIAYDRTTPVAPSEATTQRMYAIEDTLSGTIPVTGGFFTGGVWDYSQLTQLDDAATPTADPFYVNICGGHSAAVPGPYTYVGALLSYNQRRQTVQDDSTLTPGGDIQFVDNDSPFFRIPETDVSEDAYVEITLDEQDNPPYDRSAGATSDAMLAQLADVITITTNNNAPRTFRVQAPLGLVQFSFGAANYEDQDVIIKCECLGTYEM